MLIRPNNKTLPSIGAILAVLMRPATAAAGGAKLLVFVQTGVKQRALQAMLQTALPILSVTTVGRVADFERSLEEGQDAVLTLPVVMQAHGITAKVLGRRNGSSSEAYSLVGVDGAPDPAKVKIVGALDILGRDGTNSFVRGLVGRQVKVERVTKVEDLLPLLQIQRADAVLLPSRMFSEVKATSLLNLAQQELADKVELPAIASVGAGGTQAVDQTAKLSGEPARLLGVDSWQ
jgi:hypothetical protein